ncbi:MAG: hypothetical protein ACRYG6_12950 [Janthinobacterium lividum]
MTGPGGLTNFPGMIKQGPAHTSPWSHPATPTLDMTLDGGFAAPRARPAWGLRIGGAAALVAVIGLAVIGAALAIWLVATLLPVVLIAGVVAWVAFKVQAWRMRRGRAMTRA